MSDVEHADFADDGRRLEIDFEAMKPTIANFWFDASRHLPGEVRASHKDAIQPCECQSIR